MYLPHDIPNAKVLITVKTYPNPSRKYGELVCNAGFLETGEWVRIYPIRFRQLPFDQQYSKFNWIQVDLTHRKNDFRLESYQPRLGIDDEISILDSMSTGKNRDWAERKAYALREVFTSMNVLIEQAKASDTWKSLATVKPKEIIDFQIERVEDRNWNTEDHSTLVQHNLFEQAGDNISSSVVRKLPYKYYYRFITEGDEHPRRMMIEDWEIGALYWNCLAKAEGDEVLANQKVREKYEDYFARKRDLYFFVGTTLRNHQRAPNPFIIIGVFWPPHDPQPPHNPQMSFF